MGSSNPTQAQLKVPDVLAPTVSQAQGMVPQFQGMTLNPNIYNMTPLQSSAQGSAQGLFGSGGAIPNAQATLAQILSPGFTNPSNNPNLSSVLGLAQQQFTQGLGGALDMLGSQFGLSGQTPNQSGAFMNSADQLSRNALSDYGLNVGNILANQYNTGINQQLQGVGALGGLSSTLGGLSQGIGSLPQTLAATQQQGQIDLSQIPFSMLMQILQATPVGYDSFGPSPLSQNLSGLASLLQGGGLAAMGAGALM